MIDLPTNDPLTNDASLTSEPVAPIAVVTTPPQDKVAETKPDDSSGRNRKKILFVGGLVLMIITLVGLVGYFMYQRGTKQNGVSKTNANAKIVIGFSMGTLQEERWQRDRDEFVKETDRLGVALNLLSSNNNAELQLQQARNLIAQKVDVLVIAPYDADSIAPAVSEAQAAGIKVISYDRLIRGADVDLYVSFDNKEVGRQEAQGVINVVNKGRFAYIGGSLTDNNALLLKEGSMEVLQPYIDSGEIKLVYEEFTADWKPENAYSNLKGFLQKNSPVDAVIAANDGTAFGSIKALTEYGLVNIPVSGQDAELSACQRVVEGTQTMTVYKPIPKLVQTVVAEAIKMASGETPEVTSYVNNGNSEIPSNLIRPTSVTKDNMMTTVISDGYHSYDEVYANVPSELRPEQ